MRIVFNIATSYARFLTGIVAVVFLTPFTLNMVGVEQFGLWSLCLALTGALGLLDMGLSTAAVKYVAECSGNSDHAARNEAVSTLMVVYAGLGLICMLLVFSLIPMGPGFFNLDAKQTELFKSIMVITGLSLAVALPLSVFRSALIGDGRFHVVNLVELGSILLNALLVVVLLSRGWSLIGLAIANASVMLSAPLILMPLAMRKIPEFRLGSKLVRFKKLKEVAPLAVYFMLANIAVLITLRSDAIIIKGFLPLSAVAAFAIAAKISEYAFLLNKQFSNALMPLVSSSASVGDKQTVTAILTDGTRFLMIFATPLLGLLFFYAEQIVTLWVGLELIEVVLPLRILLVAVFFSTLQLNAANVLGMTGGHRGVAWTMIGSALLNILLSVLLIPRIGLAGAAISTLAAAVILEFGVMSRRACNQQGLKVGSVLRGLIPVIGSAIPMLLVAAWLVSQWAITSLLDILLQGIIAALVFASVAIFTSVRRDERNWAVNRLISIFPNSTIKSAAQVRNHHA
jgi:O-antigen/teichoic acid export membrane protein